MKDRFSQGAVAWVCAFSLLVTSGCERGPVSPPPRSAARVAPAQPLASSAPAAKPAASSAPAAKPVASPAPQAPAGPSPAPQRAAASAAKSGDPCKVKRADLDNPDPHCLVAYDDTARPAPDKLKLALAKPASIASGTAGTFVLELRNPTKKPIVVPLPAGCTTWTATAISRKGTSSYESDCGGLCAQDEKMLRLTLLPGGVLTKTIFLRATRVHVGGLHCEKQDLGPLPPGVYTLYVDLPWAHRAPTRADPDAVEYDEFTAPLRVTR